MDYKQAILKEIETLPAEMLPQIHRLLHDVRERRLSVEQILARAGEIAAERKAWTREQHIKRLLEVAEEIRQEAIAKGVALDRDEDAALESVSPQLFLNNQSVIPLGGILSRSNTVLGLKKSLPE